MMCAELNIVNNGAISELDKIEIDKQIEEIIFKHKDNRHEINKLVLESVSALTASENYSNELASKGVIKRFWGGITGKNRALQSKIDNNLTVAQYASQQTLQKLAEQNLMSFELITVVNNKLNASMLEVEKEINNIYGTLVTFFKKTKSDIVQLENRVERLERNVNLLNWQNSIEYQMWNGMEYVELDTVSKIVCMVRDFYDITKGDWTTSDLLLLKSAMGIIGINPREIINCSEFIRCLYLNKLLRDKLFQEKMSNRYVKEWHVSIASAINKGVKLQEEDKYVVQGVLKCLENNDVFSSDEKVVDVLVDEYSKNELLINSQTQMLIYDLMVELLYNIDQLGYEPIEVDSGSQEEWTAKELYEAEKNFKNGLHQEAFDMFLALAEKKCGRAMYYLGEYYRFGYGKVVKVDSDTGYGWHKKGAECGDVLATLNTSYMYDKDSEIRKNIQEKCYGEVLKLAESGDARAQGELYWICPEQEENKWLTLAADNGDWLSMQKLGERHYGSNKTADDYFLAIKYFTKAADLGHGAAMRYIGLMYDWGYGFPESGTEANKWYKKAAEAGCIIAARFYANNLYKGHNIAEDRIEAKKWLEISANGGDEEAIKLLKERY